MLNMKSFIKGVAAAVVAMSSFSSANAAIISGNFNAAGYAVVSFNVAESGLTDMKTVGGFFDPAISLFNSAGKHIITGDDTWDVNGYNQDLAARITTDLAAGDYFLVVSAQFRYYAALNGAKDAFTDGINYGSYLLNSPVSMQAMLDHLVATKPKVYSPGFKPYELSIEAVAEVPEPAGFALFGIGAAALLAARRRKKVSA